MIPSVLLSATLTFTATATGVEKGTAVEFAFAGKDSDRAYETMFLLDDTVDGFCEKLEMAGVPRGKPTDPAACRLWPVGCQLSFEPPLETYIAGKMPEGLPPAIPIYTGGTRLADGRCDAGTNMPLSVYSHYTLAQSPIVCNGIFNQGLVYNSFTAAKTLKKGTRVTFTVSGDAKSMPRPIHLTVRPGSGVELVKRLREESDKGDIDVLLGFADELSVAEATALSAAVASVDSTRVKLNGCSNVFYRSFLPLEKWRDRRERLVQPFELTIGEPDDTLVFIEEDWSVEGDDPKLTPKFISFSDAVNHPRTDTCLIYASPTTTVGRVTAAMRKLRDSKVLNWYVFAK